MIKQILFILSLLETAMMDQILIILKELLECNPGITAVTNGITAEKVKGMIFNDNLFVTLCEEKMVLMGHIKI
jgi:hypothetical protein